MLRRGGRVALIEGEFGQQAIKAEYQSIHGQLPFYGGRPSAALAAFLQAEGLADVQVEPLVDPVLWGQPPKWRRYLVVGMRPG